MQSVEAQSASEFQNSSNNEDFSCIIMLWVDL